MGYSMIGPSQEWRSGRSTAGESGGLRRSCRGEIEKRFFAVAGCDLNYTKIGLNVGMKALEAGGQKERGAGCERSMS
jgi:hypothetical protein